MADPDLICQTCDGTERVPAEAAGDAGMDPDEMEAFGCTACANPRRRRPTLAEWDALRTERDMWRQQYQRERVRMGYVLGWLTVDSFGGEESKQHEYIAHMDTAAAVRSRIDNLRDDLRSVHAALGAEEGT